MKKKTKRTVPLRRRRPAPVAFLTKLAIDDLWPRGTPICPFTNVRDRKIRLWIRDYAESNGLPKRLPCDRMIRAVLAGSFDEAIRRMRNV